MLHESINTIFQILYSKLITIILPKKQPESLYLKDNIQIKQYIY